MQLNLHNIYLFFNTVTFIMLNPDKKSNSDRMKNKVNLAEFKNMSKNAIFV